MNWIVARMKWVMLVSGVLTCTMLYAAVAPQAALRSTFGESLAGPLAEIVVRHWGALIALVGAMMIYGAYHPPEPSISSDRLRPQQADFHRPGARLRQAVSRPLGGIRCRD